MSRVIVNVATGRYVVGQDRMVMSFAGEAVYHYPDRLPPGCPPHAEIPYAFKAYALNEASELGGFDSLLWCDACIIAGPRPLSDLWQYIEQHGVWLARNGYTNYEWTADSAYPDLFPGIEVDAARAKNRVIPHVVATAFGISLKHPAGRAFLERYVNAAQTRAFCGPWWNSDYSPAPGVFPYRDRERAAACAPSDVSGHRHDQTAASVIAWQLGIELTHCPEWFTYKGSETDRTCLVADGAY